MIYHYSDSSIDPEFHRSYTIIWEAGEKGFMSVDVYGDTIATTNFKITAERFKKLQKLSTKTQYRGEKTSDASGTSHQLIQLYTQKNKTYELYWDNLNRETQSTEQFVDYIKANTPNFQQLLATPYKPAE